MSEEESREEIEQIVNNNEEECIKEEEVKEEVVKEEEVKEEEEVKPKPKSKAKAKAKPKIKIVKEFAGVSRDPPDGRGNAPSSPIEKPVKVDKLKQIVKCPDCGLDMTQHTLKYIHKRRGFCKADVKTPEVKTPEVKTPEVKTPVPDNKNHRRYS